MTTQRIHFTFYIYRRKGGQEEEGEGHAGVDSRWRRNRRSNKKRRNRKRNRNMRRVLQAEAGAVVEGTGGDIGGEKEEEQKV